MHTQFQNSLFLVFRPTGKVHPDASVFNFQSASENWSFRKSRNGVVSLRETRQVTLNGLSQRSAKGDFVFSTLAAACDAYSNEKPTLLDNSFGCGVLSDHDIKIIAEIDNPF